MDCSNGEVCCAMFGGGGGGGGGNVACAASCNGGFQLCASSTECPNGEQCSGRGGFMTCRTPRDGGTPPRRDGGGQMNDGGGNNVSDASGD